MLQKESLRKLRRTFISIMRGELAAKIEDWRMRARMSLYSDETTREIEDMRSALEARMRDTSHSAGLRILRQVLARMVKGEIGLRLEIFRTAAKDALHAEEINNLLDQENQVSMDAYEQQKALERLEAELKRQELNRFSAGLRIMLMLAMQKVQTMVVSAVTVFRLNFYQEKQRNEMEAYEYMSSSKMAEFTASALALQARLEQRLNTHSWKQAFAVLTRVLKRQKEDRLKAVRQGWRYNMASDMTQKARGDSLLRGIQRLRLALHHIMVPATLKKAMVLNWYYLMREANKARFMKTSAIQGIESSNSTGMNVLKNFFRHMLKNAVSRAMSSWRRNIGLEKDEKYREIRIKYEAQSRHFSQLFKR